MKNLILAVKLFFSVALIYLAVKDIDFSGVSTLIYSKKGIIILATAIFVVIVQTGFAGARLKPILQLFNFEISTLTGIELWFVGNFFTQIMISFVGGDAMRVAALSRAGVKTGVAMRAIFLDRTLGFIAIQLLFIIALPILLNLMQPGPAYWGSIGLAGISAAMIVGFFIMGFIPSKYIQLKYIGKILDIGSISRYLFISLPTTARILVLSFIMQLCNIIAIYLLANFLGANLSLFHAYIIGTPVMLIAMLPISIGGWGVRESSMIVGFGLIGISSDIALVVSLIIGIAYVIGSLPGVIVLLRKYKAVESANALV